MPDLMTDLLVSIIPINLVCAFLFSAMNTVRYIVIEKEKQLKEAMNIMGMPSWINWTAWFLRTMIFMMVANSIIVGMLKVNSTIISYHPKLFHIIQNLYLV